MDGVLCDELLQEIFQRLPASSSPSISLVSKRWLHLLRSAATTLSLRIPTSCSNSSTPQLLLSSLLPHYSSLSALTIISSSDDDDSLLLSLAASGHHRRLLSLRFLAGPVSTPSLTALSSSPSFTHLTSLAISSLRPLSFRWLSHFPSLRHLSLTIPDSGIRPQAFEEEEEVEEEVRELGLESLSLTGIRAGDHGLSRLWRGCTNLRRLKLRACEGITGGDGFPHSSPFLRCLQRLQELELRTCRTIADRVLLLLTDGCDSLTSLLLYDGGSRDGLRRFIRSCGSHLRTLDLRLPLDLGNDHLLAIAETCLNLSCLRLQSCCLVTGEGLRSLGRGLGFAAIEELVLVNCDVIEREPGLLTFLGQTLNQLRRLDLSYNEMLLDKELGSMLASCGDLVDIRLRGCRGLTDSIVVSIFKCCELLEVVDFTRCFGISCEAVEFFILNSPRLSRIHVEESKLSHAASAWASRRAIEVLR